MIIFVDLDNTLAEYNPNMSVFDIGNPIQKTVENVKQWVENGHTIVIFTARLSLFLRETRTGFVKLNGYYKLIRIINEWCKKYIDDEFEITCVKLHKADLFIDDKCNSQLLTISDNFDLSGTNTYPNDEKPSEREILPKSDSFDETQSQNDKNAMLSVLKETLDKIETIVHEMRSITTDPECIQIFNDFQVNISDKI